MIRAILENSTLVHDNYKFVKYFLTFVDITVILKTN